MRKKNVPGLQGDGQGGPPATYEIEAKPPVHLYMQAAHAAPSPPRPRHPFMAHIRACCGHAAPQDGTPTDSLETGDQISSRTLHLRTILPPSVHHAGAASTTCALTSERPGTGAVSSTDRSMTMTASNPAPTARKPDSQCMCRCRGANTSQGSSRVDSTASQVGPYYSSCPPKGPGERVGATMRGVTVARPTDSPHGV